MSVFTFKEKSIKMRHQGLMNFHSTEDVSMVVNNGRVSNFGAGKKSTDSNKFIGGNNIAHKKRHISSSLKSNIFLRNRDTTL